MARTDITATALSRAPGGTAAVSQSVDVTNGHRILMPAGLLGQTKGKTGLLALRVANTAGTDKVVTIRARQAVSGTYYADWHATAGQGDLTVTVAATNGVQWITGLEAARFAQDDGSVYVDYASGTTGTIEAYVMPDPLP